MNPAKFRKSLCLALLVLGALGGGVVAQTRGQTAAANNEPSRQPILRIETGMHTAPIRRISVDVSGRYLVTASEDKTARVWELATGRLLRVLRPPIDEFDEGKLYAVAFSPDGRTIAVGGCTGYTWDKQSSIYLFEWESGRLLRRVAGLPNVIYNLVYSPDGRWLAATLGEKNGVRVYATSNYAETGADHDYGDEISGVDFDAAGRLATTCWDGYVRLYAPISGGLRLAAKQKVRCGNQPYSISFAPSGRHLAVGYYDSTCVAVLSSNDLKLLYTNSPDEVLNGNLSNVAWLANGQTLAAGGDYHKGIQTQIRQWSEEGRARYRDVSAANNTIVHMLGLRDGKLVYGAADPAWGVLDARGGRVRFSGPAIADHRSNWEGFLLSSDGSRVQFGYEMFGKSPVKFVVNERRLETVVTSDVGLTAPRTTSLAISDWKNGDAPKLNGKPLKLKQYEFSRSLAIAHDGTRFLLGTDFWLHLFDRSGRELWQVAVPRDACSVNISSDGRLAAAAFGDGTIRWYRMSDGKELLAFFPHNDRKRWVLWTPQGYYDASPSADELIGWHINNGKDQAADFYPISRFFEQYYRPDVVTEVIRSVQTDEEVVARLGASGKLNIAAGIKRPPKVSFLSPRAGEQFDREQVEIAISAQDLGGGVDEVRLFHNGKLISGGERGQGVAKISGTSVQRTFTAQLVEGENRFTAVALSQQRVESEAAELAVTLRGLTQEVDLHLLVIGINRYRNSALNLNYAEADAQGIASFFDSTQSKRLFRQVQVHRLLNEQATLQGIKQAFDQIKSQARPQDTVVIYLAGHGDVVENEWYFVPHDLTTPEMESDMKKGGLSRGMLEEMVKSVQARKFFMMLDACKSGGAVIAMRGYEERKALAQLARSTGIYVVSATTDKQLAAEMSELGHGVFTYVLLEGLKGKAGAPKITVEGLIQYVKDKLPDLTEKYRGAPQYPVSWTLKGMDFPLVLQGEVKK